MQLVCSKTMADRGKTMADRGESVRKGSQFKDFASFHAALQDYQKENNVFYIRNSRTVAAANKLLKK
jgi:hypothetical protein